MEWYQVASIERFSQYNIDLSNARQLKQAGEYNGMYVRHLELSNGNMALMWEDSVIEDTLDLKPITRAELDVILANEPREEV